MGMTARASLPDRDQLVTDHVSLVKTMAHRLAQRLPTQVELNDLISAGIMGLMDAATRYRPSTGVPFSAFARRRIRGSMLDALRDLDWAPRSVRRLRRQLDTAMSQARQGAQKEPAPEEVAAILNMSIEEYDQALEQVRALEIGAVRQLDEVGPDGHSLLEVCIDPGEAPDARLARRELQTHLAAAIQQLPDRERQILALYYEEELTLAEVGEVIGVGESRVSQLRSLALSRLRTLLREAIGVPEARP